MRKANESNIETSNKVVPPLNQEALSETEADGTKIKSAIDVEDYVLFTRDELRSFNGKQIISAVGHHWLTWGWSWNGLTIYKVSRHE